MINKIKEKVKIFHKNKVKTFIANYRGDYFFCEILEIHEDFIVIKSFIGRRMNELDRIFYLDIQKIEEYKELEKLKNDNTNTNSIKI